MRKTDRSRLLFGKRGDTFDFGGVNPPALGKRGVAGWEKAMTHAGSLPVLGAGAGRGWGLSE